MRQFGGWFLFGVILATAAPVATAQTIFSEDFNLGWNGWTSTNGNWDVGLPTAGPPDCPDGGWCAGTNLDGNYPNSMNTTLKSPSFALPNDLAAGESLKLRFWYWMSVDLNTQHGTDQMVVEVHLQDGTSTTVSGSMRAASGLWTVGGADLTPFAGQTVQIGYHASSGGSYVALGWYVDLVSVTRGPSSFESPDNNPENCESGWGDWYTTNGLWQLGVPGAGPSRVPSGDECFGTNLNGNYPNSMSTSLISPVINVSPQDGETPFLRFQHWFRFDPNTQHGRDEGKVSVSEDNGQTWTQIAGPFQGSSSGWSRVTVDLTQWQDKSVLVAFYARSGGSYVDAGWYVDNFELTALPAHRGVTFAEFGQGTPGTDGVPGLHGIDESSIGEYVVHVTDGLGGASGFLFLGMSPVDWSAFGGHWYVDTNTRSFAFPFTLSGGGLFISKGIDVSDYPGLTVYVQAAIADPGATQGVALTQGLSMTIEN